MKSRIAFGLCVLMMGCASSSAPDVEKTGAVAMALSKSPEPSDPQCGACTYSLSDLTIYASLDGMNEMPKMNLSLYTVKGQLLGTYKDLAPHTYAPGRATYPVSGGASFNVGYGILGWQGLAAYHTQKIPVESGSPYPVE